MPVQPSAELYEQYCAVARDIDSRLARINQDTSHLSSPRHVKEHPDYLYLLGMGDKIIPYIVHVMTQHGCTWTHLMLLDDLTDHQYWPGEYAGMFLHLMAYWINWYVNSDYYHKDNTYHGLVRDI